MWCMGVDFEICLYFQTFWLDPYLNCKIRYSAVTFSLKTKLVHDSPLYISLNMQLFFDLGGTFCRVGGWLFCTLSILQNFACIPLNFAKQKIQPEHIAATHQIPKMVAAINCCFLFPFCKWSHRDNHPHPVCVVPFG